MKINFSQKDLKLETESVYCAIKSKLVLFPYTLQYNQMRSLYKQTLTLPATGRYIHTLYWPEIIPSFLNQQ